MKEFNIEENKRFAQWFDNERNKHRWSIRRACHEADFTHPYILNIINANQPVMYNVVEAFAAVFKQPVESVWRVVRNAPNYH